MKATIAIGLPSNVPRIYRDDTDCCEEGEGDWVVQKLLVVEDAARISGMKMIHCR